MFCTNCGKENKEKDKFCAQCGGSLVVKNVMVPPTQQNSISEYTKIGGWLYVVGFGLFITPFLLAYGVFDSLSLVLDDSFITVGEQISGMVSALWFEIIVDAILILVAVYLIFLFREKKREFPKYYIWYMTVSIVYLLADYVMMSSLTTTSSEMREILDSTMSEELGTTIRVIVASLIWIVYMNKSKRVAGTFIN